MRTLFLYIASSLDGFIARPDGDISWLESVEKQGQDYGYAEFMKKIDTVIWGRKTYEKIVSFGGDFIPKDKKCYVITSQQLTQNQGVSFYNGNLENLILELKNQKSEQHIFCDGGAELINNLLKSQLIDRLIVSIIPILLGNGIRLFGTENPEKKLRLLHCQSFESGLVQVEYEVL